MLWKISIALVVVATESARPAAEGVQPLKVVLDASTTVSDVGDHFSCVTMDWWPSNKCDYDVCPWGNSGIMTAPITDGRLVHALRGLGPITLRLGGTQADNITYALGVDSGIDCPGFTPAPPVLNNNFTGGCLTADRWQQFNDFCSVDEGCRLVFGINLMFGRDRREVYYKDPCPGDWDPSNAKALIDATVAANLTVYGYELGNEIQCLTPETYAADIHTLARMLDEAYAQAPHLLRPRIIVTDQLNWEPVFFRRLIPLVADVVDVITWHNYPLGPGYGNPSLDAEVMNASFHDTFLHTAKSAYDTVSALSGGLLEIWMGETGGAFNSGHNLTSNTFMDAFWYIESLAGFAKSGHTGFCRQTLLGGNYELVDKNTLVPNPDFYGLVLFSKLMGPKVLSAHLTLPEDQVRVWSHCTPAFEAPSSVTVLALNYQKKPVDLILPRGTDGVELKVYQMTGPDLHSFTVELNGSPLSPAEDGTLPALQSKTATGPIIHLKPESYTFIVLPASTVRGAVETCA